MTSGYAKKTENPTIHGLIRSSTSRRRRQLARRRAHRKRVHAAFWNTLTWGRPALTAPKLLDRPAPHLNLHQTNFARAAAALPPDSHVSPNHNYTELRQQIHDDLRTKYPEWVEPNGESSMRLMEELETLTRRGSSESIAAPQRALEQGTGR